MNTAAISPTATLALACLPAQLMSLERSPNAAIFPSSLFFALAPLAIGASGETAQRLLEFLGVQNSDEIRNNLQIMARLSRAQSRSGMSFLSRDALFYQACNLPSGEQDPLTTTMISFLRNYPSLFLRSFTMETVAEVFAEGNEHLMVGMDGVASDRNLLKPEEVRTNTAMVIANRALAKWRWLEQFDDVPDLRFSPGIDIPALSVPGLSATMQTFYEELPIGQLARVPISYDSAEFFVFLPHAELVAGDITEALVAMAKISSDRKKERSHTSFLKLTMPAKSPAIVSKWKLEEHAAELGLGFLFLPGTYNEISAGLVSYVSSFQHNSSLEWNKVGGCATGETVILLEAFGGCGGHEYEMVVDRPFMTALFSKGVCISTALITNPTLP